MALIGFAYSNPITLMSVLDSSKWRVVMFMDTPRTLERYTKFIRSPASKDEKVVLFVAGAVALYRVKEDMARFHSVCVFDDVPNLHLLQKEISSFELVDVEMTEDGLYTHKPWTPGSISEKISKDSVELHDFSFLQKLQNSLGKRRPSVLESTSKMPAPEADEFSGVMAQLAQIKAYLDVDESGKLSFAAVLDVYAKYIFRIIPRSAVTSKVTKKLPKDLREIWTALTDFAKSDIGVRFAKAFQEISKSKDPDYRSGFALRQYGIRQYSGDFVYLSSVLPPSDSFEFLKELDDVDEAAMNNKGTFKPA